MADDLGLGADIKVLPDLDDDETLVEGLDCLAQDLALRLDNPRGLADGTDEGAVWGYDLRGQLNRTGTELELLDIVVQSELQILADDRVDECRAEATLDTTTRALYMNFDVVVGGAPHSLTLELSPSTITEVQIVS